MKSLISRPSTRQGKTMRAWFLFLSLFLCDSAAFNDRLLQPTRTHLSTIGLPNRRIPVCSKRHNRRKYKALSYPIGVPSLEQNKSWEELIGHVSSSPPENDHLRTADKVTIASTVFLGVFAVFTMLRLSSPGSWRYFMAGGVCAATSHAVPTPIDVVKTRKQVDPTLADKNFLKAARKIIKDEGMSTLWSGLGPTAWGYLLEGAIKFGVYEVLKPFVKCSLSRAAKMSSCAILNSQILAFVLCGTASGLAASFMLAPMEALRIRMVAEPNFAPNGMIEGGRKMLRQEGVEGLSKGITPMIMKQVPYTVTKNVSFDIFTRFFYSTMKAQGMALSAGATFTVPFVSAAIASVMACVSSQPGDMILSLVNAHGGTQRPSDIYNGILQSERGVRGFFVGFKDRLLHVGIIVTLQLLIYDYVKRLCGIAATGTC